MKVCSEKLFVTNGALFKKIDLSFEQFVVKERVFVILVRDGVTGHELGASVKIF